MAPAGGSSGRRSRRSPPSGIPGFGQHGGRWLPVQGPRHLSELDHKLAPDGAPNVPEAIQSPKPPAPRPPCSGTFDKPVLQPRQGEESVFPSIVLDTGHPSPVRDSLYPSFHIFRRYLAPSFEGAWHLRLRYLPADPRMPGTFGSDSRMPGTFGSGTFDLPPPQIPSQDAWHLPVLGLHPQPDNRRTPG